MLALTDGLALGDALGEVLGDTDGLTLGDAEADIFFSLFPLVFEG